MKRNDAFNDPQRAENFNASVFVNFLLEDLDSQYGNQKLNPKELKVLSDVKYLAQKVGEIEVSNAELLEKIFLMV